MVVIKLKKNKDLSFSEAARAQFSFLNIQKRKKLNVGEETDVQ